LQAVLLVVQELPERRTRPDRAGASTEKRRSTMNFRGFVAVFLIAPTVLLLAVLVTPFVMSWRLLEMAVAVSRRWIGDL